MNVLKSLVLTTAMLFVFEGCGANREEGKDHSDASKAVSKTIWTELDANLYALDIEEKEILFSVYEEYPVQLSWVGDYEGEEAQGYLAFEHEGDTTICEFMGSTEYEEFDFRFDYPTKELATLGFVFNLENAKAGGKTCICFGNAAVSCSDENCDIAEDCGNGKPKCRWKSGVLVWFNNI